MRTNYYVIFEEDQDNGRSILDIIDMSKISRAPAIRQARSMKMQDIRVLVCIDDDATQTH